MYESYKLEFIIIREYKKEMSKKGNIKITFFRHLFFKNLLNQVHRLNYDSIEFY